MLIVFMYVDDLIFIGDFGIEDFKAVVESEFEMTDLRLMKFFLGIEVHVGVIIQPTHQFFS